jgi:hypothetical protein
MRFRMVVAALLVSALAVSAKAQDPVQRVLTLCPTSGRVVSEREAGFAARFLSDSTASPRPTVTTRQSTDVVQFVVDTLGNPNPRTFKVVRATDSALVKQAELSLRRWHYSPAVATGCKVPQEVVTAVRW